MGEHKLGVHFSWNIIDENVAIKRTDKSVFAFRGTGIPKGCRWFWGIENLEIHKRHNLTLQFHKKFYKAHIETNATDRSRLFWYANLSKLFNKIYEGFELDNDNFPSLIFTKKNYTEYEIEFIDGGFLNAVNIREEVATNGMPQKEGKKIFFCSTKYERNLKNRKACIDYHGTSCAACGFNFEDVYGELGRDYIEVHHIVPLYRFSQEAEVDPILDLIPLCSNCHRMIHRRKDQILTVEDLKYLIEINGRISPPDNLS